MAVDTLKRLAGPTALTTSAATVYTAGAGVTATVVGIHVANESGSSATFTLSIGADAAGKRFFYQISVGAGDTYDWSGTLVLAAAELLQAYASAGTSLTLTITGVETV